MEYEIDLDIFQGPLELLYQLIKKNKIEINKVSLAEITDQYLSYLQRLKSFDLDLASQFMLIATELIELKTENLLPVKSKKEKSSKEKDLVDRLKQYKKFKKAAHILRKKRKKAVKLYTRRVDITKKYDKNYELEIKKDENELAKIYLKAKKSSSTTDNNQIEKEEKLNIDYINEDNINVSDKINYIMNKLKNKDSGIKFKQIINNNSNCLEIIVTLLAMLELIHRKKIKIEQDKLFSEIKIYIVNEKVFS